MATSKTATPVATPENKTTRLTPAENKSASAAPAPESNGTKAAPVLTEEQKTAKRAEVDKLEKEAIELATEVIKDRKVFRPEIRQPISEKIRVIKDLEKELGITKKVERTKKSLEQQAEESLSVEQLEALLAKKKGSAK